jgi:hypothetical protein
MRREWLPSKRFSFVTASALAIAVSTMWFAPASALSITSCDGGCNFSPTPPGDFYTTDYTVPPDGKSWRWEFTLQSVDTNATMFVNKPNEIFSVVKYQNSDGSPAQMFGGFHTLSVNIPSKIALNQEDTNYIASLHYNFAEHVLPHYTWIDVNAPANFDHCGDPAYANRICGGNFNIWGNSTGLTFNSTAPGKVFFSSYLLAAPEPAAWALMIGGMFGVGAVLRGQRSAAAT